MISFIVYWKVMMALIYNIRSVCRRTAESSSRANILKTELRKTLKLMKIFAFGFLSTVSLYVMIPAKTFIVDNEWMALIPMEILFCDQSTLVGFLVANVVQAELGLHGTIASISYELIFIIIISNYSIFVNLLAEDFKDLDKMWTDEIKVTVAYRHAFLLNICKKRQDMNRYDFTIIRSTFNLCLFSQLPGLDKKTF